jgi:hypothetical protein
MGLERPYPSIKMLMASLFAIGFAMPAFSETSEKYQACLDNFSQCTSTRAISNIDIYRITCESRRKELKCDQMKEIDLPEMKNNYFTCDSAEDVCEQANPERKSMLYSCGEGVGGFIVDSVLGLILLPKTIWELAKNMKELPAGYTSCSSDFNEKLVLLGALRPPQMTNETIERLSCGEIREFVQSKAQTILSKLETRRLKEATLKGKENISFSDLKLSDQEIQALNYDLKHSGPMRKARCYRPDFAANLACKTLTSGAATVLGAAGTAHFIRSLSKNKTALKAGQVEAGLDEAGVQNSKSGKKPGEKDFSWDSHNTKTETSLNEMGVEYSKIPKGSLDLKGNRYLTNYEKVTPKEEWANPRGVGELYEVKSLKGGKGTSPVSPALKHVDTPELLKEMNRNGYELIVDSTLDRPGSVILGQHNGDNKTIKIRPSSTWSDLIHEYQHSLFEMHIKNRMKSLRFDVIQGDKLEDLISDTAKAHFSKPQISEMEKLMKARVGELAINERMATMKQLEILGWRRVATQGLWAEKYGLQFTQKYLSEKASTSAGLDKTQERILREVNMKIARINLKKPLVESAPYLAGSAAVGVFGASLFYSDLGEVIFRDPSSGRWVKLQNSK